MSSITTSKAIYARYLAALSEPAAPAWRTAAQEFFAADANVNAVHPFNQSIGPEAHFAAMVEPMMAAFDGLYRRHDLLMAGAFEGGAWVTSMGYYAGHFRAPFLGIPPTKRLAYLRFGEFHRLVDGRAVESYIYLDLPELMIAAGSWPISRSPGYDGYLPGPASQDGVNLRANDPGENERSYRIVTEMLSKLNTLDEGWRPYWHPNMLWYGPAAFGSYIGVDNFAGFQVPFERCFKGWAGGSAGSGRTKHFTRFGDGNYTCSGGWPSLSGVSVLPFLDQRPTGKMTFMRVCDWWRREGDLLMENWVFVDIPHVLLQFDCDVFARLK